MEGQAPSCPPNSWTPWRDGRRPIRFIDGNARTTQRSSLQGPKAKSLTWCPHFSNIRAQRACGVAAGQWRFKMKTKFSFSKKPHTSLLLATATLLFLSMQSATFADSGTWASLGSTDWNTDGNWVPVTVGGVILVPPRGLQTQRRSTTCRVLPPSLSLLLASR